MLSIMTCSISPAYNKARINHDWITCNTNETMQIVKQGNGSLPGDKQLLPDLTSDCYPNLYLTQNFKSRHNRRPAIILENPYNYLK